MTTSVSLHQFRAEVKVLPPSIIGFVKSGVIVFNKNYLGLPGINNHLESLNHSKLKGQDCFIEYRDGHITQRNIASVKEL